MTVRIGRTISPAASPIYLRDIISGISGLVRGERTVKGFEEELKEYFQVSHCFTVSSGKAALVVLLQALKEISPDRNEVVIPAFTCYSVPSAIVRAGLKIQLCDLNPGSLDFNHEQLASIIASKKDRLLCIIPVHLFGVPTDVDLIRKIVADDSIIIVEDAAQAMGGEYEGKKLGCLGDVGFFSLGRGKALSTVEGGIIITQRDDIADHIWRGLNELRDHGVLELLRLIHYAFALMTFIRPSLFWIPKALPFLKIGETIFDPDFKMRKISAFQAGLARGWKGKLREFRRNRAGNIRELLDGLKRIGINPLWGENDVLPDLIRFPLKIESQSRREAVLKLSEQWGLGIARTYPDSIDSIPELNLDADAGHFPGAKEFADKLLTLPVHPCITIKDRNKIVDLLAQVKQT